MFVGYIFIIIAVAWFLVYVLCRYFKLDKKFGWSFGPLFLLMRTTRFNNLIKKIAKRYVNLWRIIGNISIFTGLIVMFISIGLLLYSLIDFFLPNPTISGNGPAVSLIIPGVTISFRTALYLILPLILTMIPHELAHGVVAHADAVDLKSTGLLFFAIFFGAFVEPNEEDLLKSSIKTKMRTYAAGTFPNLVFGLLTIPLLVFSPQILSVFFHAPDGILIYEVVNGSPAEKVGLVKGVAIFDINNTHISTQAIFSQFMGKTTPNQIIHLNTTAGIYNIELAPHPENNTMGYLGIISIAYQEPKFSDVGKFFPFIYNQQIMWLLVVFLGSVMFNVLPIPFLLDGDKLLSTFLLKYIKKEKIALIILDIFRFLAIVLFLANVILPLIRNGFGPLI